MLRILIFIVFTLTAYASTASDYIEPERSEIISHAKHAKNAISDANTLMNSQDFLDSIARQQQQVSRINVNSGLQIELPDFLNNERTNRYLAHALAAEGEIKQGKQYRDDRLLVLVSFSMPQSQIKELIREAEVVGARIVLRGLIDDDFPKTIKKLTEITDGIDKAGGLQIDPTIYSRFNISNVPAFILPLNPVSGCSESGCEIPEHIRAEGSASINYFLELVARVGSEKERMAASRLLAKYGDVK